MGKGLSVNGKATTGCTGRTTIAYFPAPIQRAKIVQTECNDKRKAEGLSFAIAEVQPILSKVVQTECNDKRKAEGLYARADYRRSTRGLKARPLAHSPGCKAWVAKSVYDEPCKGDTPMRLNKAAALTGLIGGFLA